MPELPHRNTILEKAQHFHETTYRGHFDAYVLYLDLELL